MEILNPRCIYDISDEEVPRCYVHGYICRCGDCTDGIDTKGEKLRESDEGWQE